MPEIARLHALVRGHVQGVGFRYSVVRVARSLGLRGWVRNLPDGTVEVQAHGAAPDIDKLSAWLHGGPDGARVDAVELLPDDDTAPTGPDFEVRF